MRSLLTLHVPYEEDHAPSIKALAEVLALSAVSPFLPVAFADMESLDHFTQYLEFALGAKVEHTRDDLARMGISFETAEGIFSMAPGYHLFLEFTPAQRSSTK